MKVKPKPAVATAAKMPSGLVDAILSAMAYDPWKHTTWIVRKPAKKNKRRRS